MGGCYLSPVNHCMYYFNPIKTRITIRIPHKPRSPPCCFCPLPSNWGCTASLLKELILKKSDDGCLHTGVFPFYFGYIYWTERIKILILNLEEMQCLTVPEKN